MAGTDAQSLFDTLAGSFGHGVDRPALNSFVANSQAMNGLRTAQTDEAIGNAQKQQDEAAARTRLRSSLTNAKDDNGNPYLTPSEADLVLDEQLATHGSFQEMEKGLQEAQRVRANATLGNPNQLNTPAQTAAAQVAKGGLLEPVAAPDTMVTPAGVTPNISQTSEGAAKTREALARAKLAETQAAAGGFRPQAGANAADVLSDDAAFNAGVQYNLTRALPALGMGPAAAQSRRKILEFAAKISTNPQWTPDSWAQGASGAAPGAAPAATPNVLSAPTMTPHPTLSTATDTAASPTDFKANAAALSDMTKRTSVADTSEQTALKNLALAQQLLQKADQTGSPLANSIVNKVRAGAFGDPDVSAYQNAISTARNEYARVISMATGAQGITDHAMKEGQKLFPDDLAPEQFASNFAAAQQEMANRTGAMHQQISNLKRGIHTPATDASTSAPVTALPPGWSVKTN